MGLHLKLRCSYIVIVYIFVLTVLLLLFQLLADKVHVKSLQYCLTGTTM